MATDPAQIPTFSPPSPPETPKVKFPTLSKRPLILFAILLFLLIIAYLVWHFQYLPQKLETFDSQSPPTASLPSPSPSGPSPSPAFLLQGKQSYSISQGDKTVPQITKAIINPIDPKLNETQTVQVKVSHTSPVNSVTLKLTSDNDQAEINMKLVEGTNLNGTWEATWEIKDTVLYNYLLTITAKSDDKTGSAGIAMRSTL